MKIELSKEDFVTLAVLASCADLPDEEEEYKKTVGGIIHSLDKDVAAEIAGEMLAKALELEWRHGASRENLIKETAELLAENGFEVGKEDELDLDENDGDVLKRALGDDVLKRIAEDDENDD